MTDVAVFGARGYLGREIVKILADHPSIATVHPVSSTVQGQPIGDVVPSMRHHDPVFVGPEDEAVGQAEAVFLATGAQQASAYLETLADVGTPDVVVDLSRAHRQAALGEESSWTYGLPEIPGHVTEGTQWIANPGCYPTAALLSIAPVLQADLIGGGPIVVDGKSGVSGAGATPREDLHFPETNESLRAYGVEGHDHQAEIQAASANLAPREVDGSGPPVRFTPHLVPQNRGLLTTTYAPIAPDVGEQALAQAYEKAYGDQAGIALVEEPDTAHVRGSNRADVAWTIDAEAGLLVARCAIDNLVKGGAGTAVHNVNLALGFPERAGLPEAGVAP